MEKEIIITKRSKKSCIYLNEGDLPGEVKKIGVLEFGFDNNLFNLKDYGFLYVGDDSFTLYPGHYEIKDVIEFVKDVNMKLKKANKISENELIKLVFHKPSLKFIFYNNTHHEVFMSTDLLNFLKLDFITLHEGKSVEGEPFTNLTNRVLFIKCNNIKYGERYGEKNSKILLTHYVKSNFGEIEMEDYHKKVKYYDYIIQDSTLECVLTITDEDGNNIDYTENSCIYLKLSVIVSL